MAGHRERSLVGLVAEAHGPLTDYRRFGVAVVVKGRRRAARFGGNVDDGRRQNALARDDRSRRGVNRGPCPAAAAVRRERPNL
jgi:hypothetical protein